MVLIEILGVIRALESLTKAHQAIQTVKVETDPKVISVTKEIYGMCAPIYRQ